MFSVYWSGLRTYEGYDGVVIDWDERLDLTVELRGRR